MPRSSTTATKVDPSVIARLASVLMAGGEPLGEVTVVRRGDQIILPDGMSTGEGITWLQRQMEAEESVVQLNEYIDGFPLDVAHALALAVKDLYGFKSVSDFFPRSISLEIDAEGTTEQVYIGEFRVPTIEGSITTKWAGAVQLNVQATIKQRDQAKFHALVVRTREMLQTHSVYRGKAFRLTFDARSGMPEAPKFIKTGGLGQLQVNEDIAGLLQVVTTPVTDTARCRQEKVPLKRSALLEGPYGTGKSLFGAEMAVTAIQNGWTFIYLRDVQWLAQGYAFAQFYAPAVLFAEDIDLAVDPDSGELTAAVRNTIDGVDTKKSEIVMLLTTNYPEKLPKSLLRPGRLDSVIPFRAPDAPTVIKLLRQYAGSRLPHSESLDVVGHKMGGKIPAVIREVVERAKLHMISRKAYSLTSRDLELAAQSMDHHMRLFEGDKVERASFAEQFGGALGDRIGAHMATALKHAKDGDDYRIEDDAERLITDRHLELAPAGATNGNS